MKKIEAKIIADSINDSGTRLTTYLLTYPRFIHSELMTHRVFSRNSASSRAIPFDKMIKMVQEDPFIPIAWQKDHKGMQGSEYIDPHNDPTCAPISDWLSARDCAVESAKEMHADGITKQLCNRLLEPFMWHTVIVTATEWNNFFDLRCPKYNIGEGPLFKSKKDSINYMKSKGIDTSFGELFVSNLEWIKASESGAEIHIQALAEAMWDAMNESTPKHLSAGELHIPFGDNINLPSPIPIPAGYTLDEGVQLLKAKIAVARCARLSYMTFDGKIDYGKDIELYTMLERNKHMSPFEHVAICPEEFYNDGTFIPEKGYTHEDMGGCLWSGNFRNWIQWRQII